MRTRIIVLKLVLIGVILCCPRSDGFRNAGGVQVTVEKEIKVSVDRIENGLAILVLWDDCSTQIEWPVSLLPESTSEGSVLSIRISQDEQKRNETRQKISGLLQKFIQKGQ